MMTDFYDLVNYDLNDYSWNPDLYGPLVPDLGESIPPAPPTASPEPTAMPTPAVMGGVAVPQFQFGAMNNAQARAMNQEAVRNGQFGGAFGGGRGNAAGGGYLGDGGSLGGGGMGGGYLGAGGVSNATAMNPALAAAMLKSYQDAYQEAKAANESRYAQLLGNPQAMAAPAAPRYGREEAGKTMRGTGPAATLTDNQQRYNANVAAASGGTKDLYVRGMGYLDSLNNQQQKNINEQYTNLNAEQQGRLVARGLGNTTATLNAQNAVERERQRALAENANALARERLAADQQLTANTLGVVERRTDPYPDVGLMTNLAFQAGRYGTAGGGSGGGSGSAAHAPGGYGSYSQIAANTYNPSGRGYQLNSLPAYSQLMQQSY